MDGFPTSLKEDLDILEKDAEEPSLECNKRTCIMWRKCEKQILTYYMSCADKAEKLASMSLLDAT